MKRLNIFRAVMASLCVLAFFTAVEGQGPTANSDPRIGTWKLNLEKSQYTAGVGPQAPKMLMRRLESRPDGFTVFTQIGLDGAKQSHLHTIDLQIRREELSRIHSNDSG